MLEINCVKWDRNATGNVRILRSADEITHAQGNGELKIAKSDSVINSPPFNKIRLNTKQRKIVSSDWSYCTLDFNRLEDFLKTLPFTEETKAVVLALFPAGR